VDRTGQRKIRIAKKRDIIKVSNLFGLHKASFCPKTGLYGSVSQKISNLFFIKNRGKYSFSRLSCVKKTNIGKKIIIYLKKLLTLQLPHTSRYERGEISAVHAEKRRGGGMVCLPEM